MRQYYSLLVLALCLLLAGAGQAAPRKVLAEVFTSTTCAPCYAADVYFFQTWLPTYGGADQVIPISYHVWWPTPGNDPMYLANPTPVQAREAYYRPAGGSFSPRMMVDGFIDAGYQYNTWPGAIDPRFLDSSHISITLTGSRNGSTLNLNASIYAEAVVNSANWRVHWVVVESGISAQQNTPTGYVPFVHEWVHRGMYPDGNGSPISIVQGQTVDIQRTITLDGAWVADSCKVIVFVQNNTDKKVQNAEIISIDALTGVADQQQGLPTVYGLSQNFPNPFNPSTTISFAVPRQGYVSLAVFNLLGQEVRTLVAEEKPAGNYEIVWDGRSENGRELPSGMYLYQMKAGGITQTRRMILLK